MSNNDELSFHEQLKKKENELLEKTLELDVQATVELKLAQKNLAVTGFPVVPRTLIGVIYVVLPGEDEPQLLTDSVYGEDLRPVLTTVDAANLQQAGLLLQDFWSYCIAYVEYLRTLVMLTEAQRCTWEERSKYFTSKISMLYTASRDAKGKALKVTEVRYRVAANDTLREWAVEMAACKTQNNYLKDHVKSIEEVLKFCSRLMTSKHREMLEQTTSMVRTGGPAEGAQKLYDVFQQRNKGGAADG